MTPLNTSILSFAFSGILPKANRAYEAPRPVSQSAPKSK